MSLVLMSVAAAGAVRVGYDLMTTGWAAMAQWTRAQTVATGIGVAATAVIGCWLGAASVRRRAGALWMNGVSTDVAVLPGVPPAQPAEDSTRAAS